MHEVLVRPVLAFHLAFGLDWLPLISGRASSAARRIARQRRATHIVLDGEAAASFGYGLVRSASRRRGRVLYSAAQNMARLYPTGAVAAIIPLEQDGHWFVAVHEGAVMARTDIIYRSLDHALEALHALQRVHPRLVALHADGQVPTMATIAGASEAGTALRNTGYQRRQWLLWTVFLGLSLLIFIFYKQATISGVAQVAVPAMDAAEIQSRWAQAAFQSEQGFTVHGVAATFAVLRHSYDIPAQVVGWTLTRATCQAEDRSWHCSAHYDRKHRNANNQGLLIAAPKHWKLDFPSLGQANATWVFQSDGLPPQNRQIDSVAHNRRHLQSAWQAIEPAFSKMVLGPPRPVHIEAPQDADGRPLPRPSNLRAHTRRIVEFDGPLRSFSLLLPHTRAIGWRSITLTHAHSAQPSLASSRLRATMHGDLYELYKSDTHLEQGANSTTASVAVMGVGGGAYNRHAVLDDGIVGN